MKINFYLVMLALAAAGPGYTQQATYYYNGKQRINVRVQGITASTTKTQALARSGASMAASPAILRPVGAKDESADQVLTQQLSFKLKPGTSLKDVQAAYGLSKVEKVSFADDIFIAEVPPSDNLLSLRTANRLQESGKVEWSSPMIAQKRHLRWIPNDTYFANQWSLRNLGTANGGVAGNDIKVTPAWDLATGAGVNIVISDEGVQTNHPDLAANARTDIDRDIQDNDDDPTPSSSGDYHGTGCAGIAAAVANNGIGIAGIAHQAGIVGVKLHIPSMTDQNEADSITWKAFESNAANSVSVNSNSWGPDDTQPIMEGPRPLAEAALEAGATTGRQGKGVVYVWAAGNGGQYDDNVNRDGYANNPYVIAIGATDSKGSVCFYSEPGAPILVNTSSGDNNPNDNIYTATNTGYTSTFNGTSAAAPAAAGVVALLLQVNPALTYRDVMHILVKTATKNDPLASSWFTNGAGLHFNHYYGFGRINTGEAVTTASAWTNVPTPATPLTYSFVPSSPVPIPDNSSTGISFSMPVSGSANFRAEHVELEVDITHTYRGDLDIRLVSPLGTESKLFTTGYDDNENISHWKFRTVANWDENPNGNWTVKIADLYSSELGSVNSLTLKVRGYEKTNPPSAAEEWYLY